ncbi:GerMN domain [Syntrophomonas zehnderi OL-4]|uniref:GerMN domain n=1 Tax=Syntrophomonas zehnderi OL-4 TaxID=690567 RepID=A0A0E4C8G7_9FIRM|nr:Gmad2 immunoglobulin-like domain-containing protein [Syntrophomonas zehnderi]CFX43417.1 GerMN domain [Syntrophomonas zehnderi OL-4]
MKQLRKYVLLVLVLALFVSVSGCKNIGDNKGNDKPAPEPPATPKTEIAVYYVKMTDTDTFLVREVHKIDKTADMPKAAVEELIKGQPSTPDAYRVLPPETKVLGVNVNQEGLATVNFSSAVLNANVGASGEEMGIFSIVNTLTEFPNIKQVSFMVDGQTDKAMNWWGHVGLSEQPFSRNLSAVHEPAIWVTSPTPGQTVSNPVEIKGTARVFEATISYRIVDDQGKELAEGFTTASAGAPDRGEFSTKAGFQTSGPGKGKIEVFWQSMKDGSVQDKVTVPVEWK